MSTVSIDMDRVAKYVSLKQLKEELEQDLKGLNQQIRDEERELLSQFEAAETSSVKTKSGTVSMARQIWSSPKEGMAEQMIEAIRARQPELVKETINAQSLSSFVRELTEGGENPLPADLADLIEVKEVYQLRVRKS